MPFIIVVGTVVILGLGSVWSGFVLSIMWGWFITPTFEGAPELSIPAAIGISMIAGYLTYRKTPKDPEDRHKSDERKLFEALGGMLLLPAMYLALGWVVHLFM